MLDTKTMLENLKDYLETDEGKEKSRNFMERLQKESDHKLRWIEKIVNNIENRSDEDLKILFDKFHVHSDKRREILWNQAVDGDTSLYYPLLNAISQLGNEAPDEAYGMFSSSIFDWRGYRMELYCGQGCGYALTEI